LRSPGPAPAVLSWTSMMSSLFENGQEAFLDVAGYYIAFTWLDEPIPLVFHAKLKNLLHFAGKYAILKQ
ncbi:MAG: hypothetical protein ACI4XB_08475, partial [Ruminococcus sp.]